MCVMRQTAWKTEEAWHAVEKKSHQHACAVHAAAFTDMAWHPAGGMTEKKESC